MLQGNEAFLERWVLQESRALLDHLESQFIILKKPNSLQEDWI